MLKSIETPATRVQSMICPVPFYHVYGAVNCLMMPIYQGAKSVLMPKFEMSEFLRCIDEYQITHARVVPPILLGFLSYPREYMYSSYGIGAELSFEDSIEELQVDFAQSRRLKRSSSLCRSPTDTPQKVQHRWSGRALYPGYALHYYVIPNPRADDSNYHGRIRYDRIIARSVGHDALGRNREPRRSRSTPPESPSSFSGREWKRFTRE